MVRYAGTRVGRVRTVVALAVGGLLVWAAPAVGRGTTAGRVPATARFATVRLGGLPVGADPAALTLVGTRLFFAATDPAHGRELWAVDGTATGAHLVGDIVRGPIGSAPAGLTAVGDELYFTAFDPRHGRELWRSDGSAAGTVLVADVHPGPAGSSPADPVGTVDPTTGGPGPVLFSADDGMHGRELWRTDGTPAGTDLVADLRPGPGGSAPTGLTALGSTVAFAADDGSHGRELWTSDGTTAGTVLVADLRPGPAGSNPAQLTAKVADTSFAAIPTLVFTADDGTHGREPWRYRPPFGSLAGVGPTLCEIRPGPGSSDPTSITQDPSRDDLTYLAADDGTTGGETHALTCDSGTPSGPLADVRPGPAGADPRGLTVLGAAGTGRPASDWPDGPTFSGPGPDGWGGHRVAASADDGRSGREPWVYERYLAFFSQAGLLVPDGADARLLADVRPGPGGSDPQLLTADDDTLFFTADDGSHGRELWAGDGSAPLTRLVADLRPGAGGSDPRELTAAPGALYFTADDGSHGRQPYRTAVPIGTVVNLRLTGDEVPGALPAGAPITFSAQVSPTSPGQPGAPTGVVDVAVDGVTLARSGPLAAVPGVPGLGLAPVTVTLSPGRHLLTATYSGDGAFAPAYSLSVRVTAA